MSQVPDNDDDRTIVRPARPARHDTAAQLGHTLPAGTRIRDFEITGLIGEGGFGIVYLAYDHSLERSVAVKEYMPTSMAARVNGSAGVVVKSERHQETFEAGLRSFVNEARLLARFDHPALVKVYRFWEENGTAYMVMPYYEGPTLKSALAALGRPADEASVRAWLRPLLDALAVMHGAQCYHRDIAPDNILLTASGPLLLDFGAARRVIGDMTHALTVVLKPGYAPIEQYGDVATMTQGAWTDLYALACVVYYAITGRVPMSSVERMMDDRLQRLSEVADGRYSSGFLQAIDAALAVRPQDRPQTVAQFRTLLGEPEGPHGVQHSGFGALQSAIGALPGADVDRRTGALTTGAGASSPIGARPTGPATWSGAAPTTSGTLDIEPGRWRTQSPPSTAPATVTSRTGGPSGAPFQPTHAPGAPTGGLPASADAATIVAAPASSAAPSATARTASRAPVYAVAAAVCIGVFGVAAYFFVERAAMPQKTSDVGVATPAVSPPAPSAVPAAPAPTARTAAPLPATIEPPAPTTPPIANGATATSTMPAADVPSLPAATIPPPPPDPAAPSSITASKTPPPQAAAPAAERARPAREAGATATSKRVPETARTVRETAFEAPPQSRTRPEGSAPTEPAANRGAPAAAPSRSAGVQARCSDILQKASLETLTAEEAAFMKRECR